MQEFHLDHNLSARNQTLFLSEKAWSVFSQRFFPRCFSLSLSPFSSLSLPHFSGRLLPSRPLSVYCFFFFLRYLQGSNSQFSIVFVRLAVYPLYHCSANSQFNYSCVKLYFISLCTAAPSPQKNRDVSLLDFFEWRERLYTSFILFTRWGRS